MESLRKQQASAPGIRAASRFSSSWMLARLPWSRDTKRARAFVAVSESPRAVCEVHAGRVPECTSRHGTLRFDCLSQRVFEAGAADFDFGWGSLAALALAGGEVAAAGAGTN